MRSFAAIILVCALSGIYAGADELYIPSADWPTIQSAINAAGEGDTIIVSSGIYLENIHFQGKAITVRSADPDDPNTVAETIIDGSSPADPNNASVVTFNAGEGNGSVLEGFTLTGGTGTWLAISWRYHEIYWNRCGGGIVCCNLSAPTIRKNRIVNNRAGEGGGIYVYGDPVTPFPPVNPAVHIKPVIENNLFENNTAQQTHEFTPPDEVYTFAEHGDGGAIVCFQGVDPIITGNTIRNNTADYYGGGIHMRQWSNGTLEDNTISDNDAMLGAGIHITYASSPAVRRNQIIGNRATSLGGGGIYTYSQYSNPLIEQNRIENNESSGGAGIAAYYESGPLIRNNLIINNRIGAGVRIAGSAVSVLQNNTIVNNAFTGIEISYTTYPIIINNLVASNGTYYGIYSNSSPVTIRYNNVWNHPRGSYSPTIGDQTGINGNIRIDPNWVGPDNYHLLPISPCRDSGDPNTTDIGTADFDGDPRLADGRIDIGADEVYFSPADFDRSGRVYLEDLILISEEWLSDQMPLQTDLEEDNRINLNDFDAFSFEWLWQGAWIE